MKTSRSQAFQPLAEASTSSTQPIQLAEYRKKKAEKQQLNQLKGRKLAESMRERRADPSFVPKKRETKSQKAGLIFPVNKFIKDLKKACPGFIIRENSGVMTAGVIEYLIAEILDLSGLNAIAVKKKRIVPVHIGQAVREDKEVMELLKGVTISRGGVMQFIHPSLTKKVGIKRKEGTEDVVVDLMDEPETSKRSTREAEE